MSINVPTFRAAVALGRVDPVYWLLQSQTHHMTCAARLVQLEAGTQLYNI